MSIDSGQMRFLIRETLTQIGLYSRDAEELLMLTAAAESNFGEYLKQTSGPARGYWQMEPATFNDIMYRWLPSTSDEMRNKVESFESTFVGIKNADAMMYNIKYAILLARLHYYRFAAKIPHHTEVEKLAAYYKKYYNTKLGKATIPGTIKKYNTYVEVGA